MCRSRDRSVTRLIRSKTIADLSHEQFSTAISKDEDWLHMVRTFVTTVQNTREEMKDQLEKEDMTGKFTPDEDRCYKACYDLLHDFVEKRRHQESNSSSSSSKK
jgi:HPt (histidine-containing phosphotransfer) domain-containing protein